ncbi:NAD(P)/FAD-dependent oxidoreductase [Longimicrobium sp.]|uniref:NAD(P)/FAD-dependent oxidoreductase n=1 Tax=Longimicrobium sp. TaxID=2029185 RepID=UPI003B3AB9A6
MTDAARDVVVAGGGPGGCAAALALRAHAPGLSVALVEASAYGGERVGETLPPPAADVLRHLGVWEAFAAQAHHPAYGTAAAWGTPVPYENDFLYHVRQVGWHLDRGAFDGMLADQAHARGVQVVRETRVLDAERAADGWRLSLSDGRELRARFLIDATGAGAALVRRRGGGRLVVHDRLAGFVRFFRQPAGGGTPHTLVEAFADGWWYTAPLPDGRRVVACMTDTDIARGLRLDEEAAWHALLAASAPRVSASLADAVQDGEPVVRAARSGWLDAAAGPDWIAVGDAASTFDPLSSQGILKALRSGIYAAYAAGDLLAKGDDAGMHRYRAFVQREFDGFLRTRARYYADEARWPEREFWRRRHASAAEPAHV